MVMYGHHRVVSQTLNLALQYVCLAFLLFQARYSNLFVNSFLLLVLFCTSLTGLCLAAGKVFYDTRFQIGFLFLNQY